MEIFEVHQFIDPTAKTVSAEDATIAVGTLDDNGMGFPVVMDRLPEDVLIGDKFQFVDGTSQLERVPMSFSVLNGLSMHHYSDYLRMLRERQLLEPSLHRAIRPWTAQYICQLFDCNHFSCILEIGRSRGHSFGLFRWLAPESVIISIDPHPTDTADSIAALTDGPFQFINTTSDEAFEQGLDTFFDLILIDGNHHTRAAQRDWENVLTVASPQAVVIFDNLDHQQGCGNVFREIVEDGRVERKFEPLGDQQVWPESKQFRGTFGVVLLD